MKKGLVLEGGGIRGVFTTGVLDAFMEHGIDFDYIIGVSIGSTNALNFITKQKGRGIRILNNYVQDHKYMSIRNLIKTGNYIGWDFIDKLQNKIDEFNYDDFKKSTTEMVVNVTNCSTGRSEFYEIKNHKYSLELYQATHALPIVAKPVKIKDKIYLDGGISESIPVKKAFEDKCDKVVVILTHNESYMKTKKIKSKLLKIYFRKYPKIYKALENRNEKYSKERDYVKEMAGKNKVFPIYPQKPTEFVSKLEKNLKKINKLYEMGYETGLNHIEELNNFLKEN